jgi:YfiH family protein
MKIHKIKELEHIDHGFVSFLSNSDTIDTKDRKYYMRNKEFAKQTSRLAINMDQKHTNDIITIDQIPKFDQNNIYNPGICDGLFTKLKNITLVVNTADCVPILLTNKGKDFCAVVHSGWKGSLYDINQKMIELIESQCSNISGVIAIIGPCIHQESYEVGDDLFDVFNNDNDNSKYFKIQSSGKFLFDLRGFVVDIYRNHGVEVFDLNVNTYNSEFDSYRRYSHNNYNGYCSFPSFISI